MFLGNTKFAADLDMWSLGCVAVELMLRRPLFHPPASLRRPACAKDYLEQHRFRLGSPCPAAFGFLQNLPGLPCDLDVVRRLNQPANQELLDFLRPRDMAAFVTSSLKWDPRLRMTAASAGAHPFLAAPSLSVVLSAEEGRHGPGSICSGLLDEEVLDYLQNCPSWAQLRDECLANDFTPNRCISEEEGRRRLKREFVGYVTPANRPPHLQGLPRRGESGTHPVRSCSLLRPSPAEMCR